MYQSPDILLRMTPASSIFYVYHQKAANLCVIYGNCQMLSNYHFLDHPKHINITLQWQHSHYVYHSDPQTYPNKPTYSLRLVLIVLGCRRWIHNHTIIYTEWYHLIYEFVVYFARVRLRIKLLNFEMLFVRVCFSYATLQQSVLLFQPQFLQLILPFRRHIFDHLPYLKMLSSIGVIISLMKDSMSPAVLIWTLLRFIINHAWNLKHVWYTTSPIERTLVNIDFPVTLVYILHNNVRNV